MMWTQAFLIFGIQCLFIHSSRSQQCVCDCSKCFQNQSVAAAAKYKAPDSRNTTKVKLDAVGTRSMSSVLDDVPDFKIPEGAGTSIKKGKPLIEKEKENSSVLNANETNTSLNPAKKTTTNLENAASNSPLEKRIKKKRKSKKIYIKDREIKNTQIKELSKANTTGSAQGNANTTGSVQEKANSSNSQGSDPSPRKIQRKSDDVKPQEEGKKKSSENSSEIENNKPKNAKSGPTPKEIQRKSANVNSQEVERKKQSSEGSSQMEENKPKKPKVIKFKSTINQVASEIAHSLAEETRELNKEQVTDGRLRKARLQMVALSTAKKLGGSLKQLGKEGAGEIDKVARKIEESVMSHPDLRKAQNLDNNGIAVRGGKVRAEGFSSVTSDYIKMIMSNNKY